MNEELICRALRMIEDRRDYWIRAKDPTGNAYDSAYWILLHAMNGEVEMLDQFDYYSKEN